jgi:hypothetical protein
LSSGPGPSGNQWGIISALAVSSRSPGRTSPPALAGARHRPGAVILGVSQIVLPLKSKGNVGSWWLWLIAGVVTTLFGLFLVILPGPGIPVSWGCSRPSQSLQILLIASGVGLCRLGESPDTMALDGPKGCLRGEGLSECGPADLADLPASRGSSVCRLTGP